mmetsp:Transcript_25018/g.82541  ORF Transcript_25018/g.82541 Transcript_25018/m.82541 type:complete len:575 (-) Transcript_25018:1679-3403(-)
MAHTHFLSLMTLVALFLQVQSQQGSAGQNGGMQSPGREQQGVSPPPRQPVNGADFNHNNQPPQMRPPPKNCTYMTCHLSTCVMNDNNVPVCQCYNSSYLLVDRTRCKSRADIGQQNAATAQRNQQFQSALNAMQSMSRCPHSMPACPDAANVPHPLRGQCANSTKECYGNNNTLFHGLRDSCKQQGMMWCAVTASCSSLPCPPPNPTCSASQVRCPDWSCAADAASCPSSGNGLVTCPDGMTTASSFRACAEMGIFWQGCPPGSKPCSANPNICVKHQDECEALTGCPETMKSCGPRRNAQGVALYNSSTNRPIMTCVSQCQSRPPQPAPTTAALRPGLGSEAMEVKAADGAPAFAMKALHSNAFRRMDNLSEAVNFTIAPVSASALQEGPFALLYSSGNIVSSVITIEPSAALVIDGGLTIDIPIDGSKEMCSQILQNVQMVVVSDLLNFNATPEGLGSCSMGSVGNCSCAATIYHFSTYAVANSYSVYSVSSVNSSVTESTVTVSDTVTTTSSTPSTTSSTTSTSTAAQQAQTTSTTPAPSLNSSSATTIAKNFMFSMFFVIVGMSCRILMF